jgi:hypothetical protein
MKNKPLLDQIQAKIVIEKKEKFSQQELLDRCVEFVQDHLAEFIMEKVSPAPLDDERIESILAGAIDCPLYRQDKSDDELIYGT